MKKLFYAGLAGLAIFEILKVYFIMPMPGSQQHDSIELAYFLHVYRWYFRIVFAVLVIIGSTDAFRVNRKWIPVIITVPVVIILYFFNFRMTADRMFLQPKSLVFKSRTENTLNDSSLAVVITHKGEAKAYPIRFIQYHHQVRDTLGSRQVMVTYCNVCRTGRVFEPTVDGVPETFRLVGMDHFNAMFEDATTRSWWRQSTGEAVAGDRKGKVLAEVESAQLTLNKFFSLYPFGKVLQGDEVSAQYDTLRRFERGKSKSSLTLTDSLSWKDKSWVVGIQLAGKSKAYDWNDLKRLKLIHDVIGSTPIVIALSDDGQSFAAFRREENETFLSRNDSLITEGKRFDFSGHGTDGSRLKAIQAYQEFWHSWKTFHPETETYISGNP
jgi:hypothetical protein